MDRITTLPKRKADGLFFIAIDKQRDKGPGALSSVDFNRWIIDNLGEFEIDGSELELALDHATVNHGYVVTYDLANETIEYRTNAEFLRDIWEGGTEDYFPVFNSEGLLDDSDVIQDNGLKFVEGKDYSIIIEQHTTGDGDNLFITAGEAATIGGTNGGSVYLYGAGGSINGNLILAHNSISTQGNVGIGIASSIDEKVVVDGNVKLISDNELIFGSTYKTNIYHDQTLNTLNLGLNIASGIPYIKFHRDASTYYMYVDEITDSFGFDFHIHAGAATVLAEGVIGGHLYLYGGDAFDKGNVILAHNGSGVWGNVGVGVDSSLDQRLTVYGNIWIQEDYELLFNMDGLRIGHDNTDANIITKTGNLRFYVGATGMTEAFSIDSTGHLYHLVDNELLTTSTNVLTYDTGGEVKYRDIDDFKADLAITYEDLVDPYFELDDYGVINALYPLAISSLLTYPDAGILPFINLVIQDAVYGTEQSARIQIDSFPVFIVGAYADGAGYFYDPFVTIDGDLSVTGSVEIDTDLIVTGDLDVTGDASFTTIIAGVWNGTVIDKDYLPDHSGLNNLNTTNYYHLTEAERDDVIAHLTSTGADHTYINQSVTTTSSPTFTVVTSTNDATLDDHLVKLSQMNAALAGLAWQTAVLDFFDPTSGLPGSPSDGDRYIAEATANGWTIDYIYEYDLGTTSWVESIPSAGWRLWVDAKGIDYVYTGSEWQSYGSSINHNSLDGLQGGSSASYYHLTGTQHTDLTDAGDSTLHYHATDRDRANHTGTQTSATISNFDEAVDDRVALLIQDGTGLNWTYVDASNTLTGNVDFGDFDTDDLTEGATNLYYTDARARLSISETITGIEYNNTTGVFSLTSGYVIVTTTEQTNWTAAYNDSISTVVFDTATGDLTFTQVDAGTIVENLDGRYSLITSEYFELNDGSEIDAKYPLNISSLRTYPDSGVVSVGSMAITIESEYNKENGFQWLIGDTAVLKYGGYADGAGGLISTYAYVTGTIYTDSHGNSAEWAEAYDNMIVSATFDTSDGIITFTQQDTGTITVDIDGRFYTQDEIDAMFDDIDFFYLDDTGVVASYYNVAINSLYTTSDAGLVNIANMPVVHSLYGEEMSYSIRIDSADIIKIGAYSDGAGGTYGNFVWIYETAATTDTDQFLVLDSNEIKYRTGDQVISDLGLDTRYLAFRTFQVSADSGFTWGTSNVVADLYNDTIKIVEGWLIKIGTDATSDAIRISHDVSSWVAKTTLSGAVVVSNISVDLYGHPTDWSTRSLTYSDLSLDDRYYTETEIDAMFAGLDDFFVLGDDGVIYPIYDFGISSFYTSPDSGMVTVGNIAVTVESEYGTYNGFRWIIGTNSILEYGSLADGAGGTFDAFLNLNGEVYIETIDQAISDTDKFLVSDGGTIKYRIGTDVLSDIGAEAVLTKGNLSETTSSVLTITGGTGAVIGSGVSIQVILASGSASGYLSSTDWNTFNSKANASHVHSWTDITSGLPTTLSGYGITDAYTITQLQTSGSASVHWGNITDTPTTLSGYGITDAPVPGGSSSQLQYNNAGAFAGTSNITYSSGNLYIEDDSYLIFKASDSSVLFQLYGSSTSVARINSPNNVAVYITGSSDTNWAQFSTTGVHLYYSGGVKLSTISAGVLVSGVVGMNGFSVAYDPTYIGSFADNAILGFGGTGSTADDFSLYSNGTFGVVKTHTNLYFTDNSDRSVCTIGGSSGQISLYHQNNLRLHTTSAGVQVAGQLTVGSFYTSWALFLEQPSAPTTASGYGALYSSSSDGKLYWKSSSGSVYDLTASGGGGGSVTNVTAGNGMNFTTITSIGTVTMGTPSSVTSTSTNGFPSSTTHTHELGIVSVAKGGTNLSAIAAGSILAANSLDTLTAITSTSGTYVLKNVSGTIQWAAEASGVSIVSDILKWNTDHYEIWGAAERASGRFYNAGSLPPTSTAISMAYDGRFYATELYAGIYSVLDSTDRADSTSAGTVKAIWDAEDVLLPTMAAVSAYVAVNGGSGGGANYYLTAVSDNSAGTVTFTMAGTSNVIWTATDAFDYRYLRIDASNTYNHNLTFGSYKYLNLGSSSARIYGTGNQLVIENTDAINSHIQLQNTSGNLFAKGHQDGSGGWFEMFYHGVSVASTTSTGFNIASGKRYTINSIDALLQESSAGSSKSVWDADDISGVTRASISNFIDSFILDESTAGSVKATWDGDDVYGVTRAAISNYVDNAITTFVGNVFTVEVSLSSSDILSLYSSPKVAVANPGSSKAVVVLSAECWYDFGTTTYLGEISLWIGTQVGSTFYEQIRFHNPLSISTGTVLMKGEVQDISTSGSPNVQKMNINTPLVIYSATSNPTSGDGTAKIYVTYKIIDLV